MSTALILTVGGSHQPILTCLEQYRPDRAYFLCSGDSGKTLGSYISVEGQGMVLKSDFKLAKPDLPCIVELAKLAKETYHVEIEPGFDNLDACYAAAVRLLLRARKDLPDARLVADYTGGTKSMTAGLVAAVLDDGDCELSMVGGRRADLVKVVNRTQYVRRVSVADTQVQRRLRAARALAANYDYAAAGQALRDAAAEVGGASQEALQRGIALCQAFNEWDRFAHAAASECLDGYQREFVSHWRVLKALCGMDRGHGLEWVEDLLLNADRRCVQGRYDDAVGRIYRAVELTAQVWLKQRHEIDTSDVDPQRAPENQRAGLANKREESEKSAPGKIKISLKQAWDLIAAFPDDPVGALYAPFAKKLLSFLTVRNQSLFAHGFQPISREDHAQHVPEVQTWLRQTMAAGLLALGRKRLVELEQFPTHFLDAAP